VIPLLRGRGGNRGMEGGRIGRESDEDRGGKYASWA